jgi:hypothetical protein
MGLQPYTYIAKSAAAGVCVLGLLYLVCIANSPKLHRFWPAVFFLGGALSASIGAVLEAAFDDLEHGAGWTAMLVAVEVAGLGAWCTGGVLHGTIPTAGANLLRIYVSSGVVIFLSIIIATVATKPSKPGSFDRAMELAGVGAAGLVWGCGMCIAKGGGRARAAAILWLAGTMITGAGYAVSSGWLAPICPDHQSSNRTNVTDAVGFGPSAYTHDTPVGRSRRSVGAGAADCPLPDWLTPDGVYHTSMAVAYMIMAAGTYVLNQPHVKTVGGSNHRTSLRSPLLSVQATF